MTSSPANFPIAARPYKRSSDREASEMGRSTRRTAPIKPCSKPDGFAGRNPGYSTAL